MKKLVIALLFVGLHMTSHADSLTLNQVIEIVLEKNFSILISKNNQESARIQNTIGNAGMLPKVDVNASSTNNINNTRLEFLSGDVRTASSAHSSTLTGNVLMNWTVFDGFKMFATKEYLELTESMSSYEVRSMIEGTVASAINAYTLVLIRQNYYKTLQEALRLSKERKEIYDKRLMMGTSNKVMAMQADLDMNEDSVQLIQQEKLILESKMILNYLMARDPFEPFEVSDNTTLADPLQLDALKSKMEMQNTSIQMARINQVAMDKNFQMIRSKRYPTLTLFGGVNYNMNKSQLGVTSMNRSYGPTYGATFTMNLYNGSKTSTEVQQAKLKQNNAAINYQSTTLSMQKELAESYLDYDFNRKVFEVEKYNILLAEENLKIAYEQYKVGMLNDINFREIQYKTLNAQYKYYESLVRIKQSETELLRLTGELYTSLKQ